jgi:hypothetical protein
MNLAPPPSKTPLFDNSQQTMNHVWQRWMSDLYNYLKEGITGTNQKQGPRGEKGDTGDAGPRGEKGDTGDVGIVSVVDTDTIDLTLSGDKKLVAETIGFTGTITFVE